IQLLIRRQPGANILETVERVKALLPALQASVPAAIDMQVVMERTTTIRSSLREVEHALAISIGLVVLVVFLFLRSGRATLIPAIAIPVSLCGTFAAMYLCGYSLDNLSLMALTVATGFVVDDAIVVLETISRRIEHGEPPMQAALHGAREVGFTVLSMSISLVAVFIPILAMGGIVGRFFREFAVVLSIAIGVSLLVSLTTTPMLCARWLKAWRSSPSMPAFGGRWTRWRHALSERIDRAYARLESGYERSLAWALRHTKLMLLIFLATVVANIGLYVIVPKGFFPSQDVGLLVGGVQADQSISFQAMSAKMNAFSEIVRADPAVENVNAYTGGGRSNSGFMFVTLKPLKERGVSAEQVIARLRPKLARVPGANLFLSASQDIRIGGRQSNALYQYTLRADDLNELRTWEPRLRRAMAELPELADVNTDAQDRGVQISLVVDRDAIARLGLTMRQIDNTLNDAFGQRQVSTIYEPLNQYRVVMEADPQYLQRPESLEAIHLIAPDGAVVPLNAVARWERTNAPLAVNHQGSRAASTISFNLSPGVSLGQATRAIDAAAARIGMPTTVEGGFQGGAQAFQQSLQSQPWLILAALVTIYIVLGILYESLVHPLTILSTLPSAGVGAILALLVTNTDFSIIALIGVILLVGIVKKNAIMMIDVAIDLERRERLDPRDAIARACALRFRPIMMTTVAALFGALPLALGVGDGAELRQPLGISIVGGLLLSQLITLYTTPVIYLCLDRLRLRTRRSPNDLAGVAP
ncbi:MAG TPA: efflux RND transporter permease subunit, partial [Burkholderiaceae bacterium]|nr:efflux RND transporter permease subunit [Burkholderiaceae bacterium]